jgi:plasmid stabilization system protein ParE
LRAAEQELLAAADWYRQRTPQAASDFLAAMERAVRRISEAPDRHPRYIRNTRRYLLRQFPFFVVFRATEAEVVIVAVAHTSRRPGYWRGR